jgi:DNA-directed RNA polymerase specialized sigma24 family protein
MRGAMGPMPDRAVAVLADLGLSDEEIARYFNVAVSEITSLQHASGRSSEAGAAGD